MGKKIRRRKTGLTVISAVVIMMMVWLSVTPVQVSAQSDIVYPNTATLESLLHERSFVVDTLTVEVRKPDKYGGKSFTNNPHLEGTPSYLIPNHFLYEDLINQYDEDLALKALVEIYMIKSNMENYPMETLAEAANAMNPASKFFDFLGEINSTPKTSPYFDMNQALSDAYESLGGTYPTEKTLEIVNQKIDNDHEWNDYDTSGLIAVKRKEGTAAYDAYKEALTDSEDTRDQQVLSTLGQQEGKSRQIGLSVLASFLDMLNSVPDVEEDTNPEARKKAKIYDVILNDIFLSECTSSLGVSVGKESEAKVELDECSQALKEGKDYLSHMGDLVDLTQNDAKKILVDDYLEILMSANEQKARNLTAAFDTINGIEGIDE